MPGLCGLACFKQSVDLGEDYKRLLAGHASHTYSHEQHVRWDSFPTTAYAASDTCVVSPDRSDQPPVGVLLEGWVSEIDGARWPPRAPQTAHALLAEVYQSEGIDFVNRLYGSFVIVVRDAERQHICLFADHSASRPLFWTVHNGRLIWASQLAGILNVSQHRWRLSSAAVANFIACGHHLADGTWVRGVYVVRPGECVVWSPAGPERRRYFSFRPGAEAEPAPSMNSLADSMAEVVLRATERCYRASGGAVVSLGGGLDSRLVLASLVEIGARNVRAITLGTENRYIHGDAYVAAQLTRHCGIEDRFISRGNNFLAMPDFTRRFGAETDAAAYHIGEMDALEQIPGGWPRSMYRGDECFGWLGQVNSREEAMAAVGVRHIAAVRSKVDHLFTDRLYHLMSKAHARALDTERKTCSATDLINLKDHHYFYLRLARYLHPLTHYKMFRVEMFNPLLDKEVLGFLAHVPAQYRINKQIERRLLERRFPDVMRVPVATRSSLGNTDEIWRRSAELRSFMLSTLGRDGEIWARLVRRDRVEAFVENALKREPPPRWRRFAGRLVRAMQMYEPLRKLSWNAIEHGQPSQMRLLQRLLVMRLWIDQFEDKLELDDQ